MPKKHKPRKGSLQFWPRKRAKKILPSVNWPALENVREKEGLLGFVGYKVGMASLVVQDLTQNSRMLNENIVMPVTIVECPPMKVLSIRLYKQGIVASEMLASNLDKELKRKIKLPRQSGKIDGSLSLEGITDIRLVCYTQPRAAKLKKTPDICEIGIKGDVVRKFEIAKGFLGKEINVSDVFAAQDVVDIRGVTKGKGLVGPVKRFGISLKSHKSEKGVRRPGSLGAWTPKKVSFRAPMAGQLGMFTRVQYNNKVLALGGKQDAQGMEFNGYGILRNPFLIVKGSLQGAQKRPLMLCAPLRRPKKNENYKFVRLVR